MASEKGSFKGVDRHLYKRQYQTGNGDWSTVHYGRFTDWKGKRRTFPLGDDLESARDRLGELRRLNRGRFDFDKEKEERKNAESDAEGLTLQKYIPRFLETKKAMPSI